VQSNQDKKTRVKEKIAKYEYSKGAKASVKNNPEIGKNNSHFHFDKKCILFLFYCGNDFPSKSIGIVFLG
jgi:hypothetical protein